MVEVISDEQIDVRDDIGGEFKRAFSGGFEGAQAEMLAKALLKKTADVIDNEMTCKETGKPLVAFCMKSGRLACQ